ncbi:hypothetical protein C6497_03985 [Candidatus Poribacteria bacterium]|nr:MAG: hypothetical protein C6497_03985 [Candidatus Poribacteria bacterium]
MTSEQFAELQNSLETMLNNISTGDDISEPLLQISQLAKRVESTAPKQLIHYLERKSYTKALDYLRELNGS